MSRVFLITGFNNWGKTTIIQQLFHGRQRFFFGTTYELPGTKIDFAVESHSNDDYGIDDYIKAISQRMEADKHVDLLAAFCPTKEEWNDSRVILRSGIFSSFSEVHILLINVKWDGHARLLSENIREYLKDIPSITFFEVKGSDPLNKAQEIVQYIASLP